MGLLKIIDRLLWGFEYGETFDLDRGVCFKLGWAGPVTITHPEVTRYFMTISEACQLILEVRALGRGSGIIL